MDELAFPTSNGENIVCPTIEWIPGKRNYKNEREAQKLQREEVADYPLKPITVASTKLGKLGYVASSSKTSTTGSSGSSTPKKGGMSVPILDPLTAVLEGMDPLSQMAELDPLSQMAIESAGSLSGKSGSFINRKEQQETFEPWQSKKAAILAKYTTSESKLTFTTFDLSPAEKAALKGQSTVTDKVKNRLEQLDDFEEGSVKEMLNLSQQEYINRIEELNRTLILAWEQDQRVKALKIAIQCAKLLVDTSVIQFYPSKFVLVTDILDTFGRLVYDRIHEKAQYVEPGKSTVTSKLPEHFKPSEVSESAKETCRNWFYKIASIRELVPRLYVEAAVLKCYYFLQENEHKEALKKLCFMMRGIGDPLVAVYARAYLCRVGMSVASDSKDYLMEGFDDFLKTFRQVQGDTVQNILALQKVEMPNYLQLYSPALDWMLQCIAFKALDNTLETILSNCKKQCNSALLINSIMSAFKPEYIAARASQFIEHIRECQDSGFPKHLLFRTLGLCLVVADPPENHKLQILNDVWKSIMKFGTPAEYMSCAEVWVEYALRHFTKREVNTILADIIKHMTPDRAFEQHYSQLQAIVDKILTYMHNFLVLFSMNKFLPFIDLFQKESIKVEVCKMLLDGFVKYQPEPTSDPVIVNALMFLAKTMHDSVNALTLEDEKRCIGNLVCQFLKKVLISPDFEQQLNYAVECRASFTNLEPVLTQLVNSVNQLAMETHLIVQGRHTRKTSAFVHACAAYSFITIPSISSIFLKLNLYLVSGQVALLNQCLAQADAFFKAAISSLPDVPRSLEVDGKFRSTEPMLLEFVSNMCSALVIVPDPPEQGVLYLVRGLLNVLQNYTWDYNSDGKALSYIRVLCLLSALYQEDYIYHVGSIDSNDRLYGSDPKFLAEIRNLSAIIIEEITRDLQELEHFKASGRQENLSLELFHIAVAHGDLSNTEFCDFLVKLWKMVKNVSATNKNFQRRIADTVKKKISPDKNIPDKFSDLFL